MESLTIQTLPQFNGKLTGHALYAEWIEWKNSFEIWADAMGYRSQSKRFKWLLVAGGRDIQRIYTSTPVVKAEILELKVPLREIPVYDNAVLRLESYFNAKSNPRLERQLLCEMKQEKEESFNAYVVRLRMQAIRCGFTDERLEEEVYFQIMSGARIEKVRQYAATETAKSLENLISYAINEEIKEQQQVKVRSCDTATKQMQEQKDENIYPQVIAALKNWSKDSRERDVSKKFANKCYRCGSMKHNGGGRCPAVDAICHFCKKSGHFARVCIKKRKDNKIHQTSKNNNQINNVDNSKDDWDLILPKKPQVE